MLAPLERTLAVLVMISSNSKSVSICNRFHARWANSGQITISKGGTPLSYPHSRGISSPSGTKITSLETRDSRLSYGEDPESLSYLGLVHHRVVSRDTPDKQTDRIAIANTRLCSTAVARKNQILKRHHFRYQYKQVFTGVCYKLFIIKFQKLVSVIFE